MRPRPTACLAVLVALAAPAAAGCFHHQAHVPGVIDMRTDGSGARPASRVDVKESSSPRARVMRTSTDGLIEGNGVVINGADISVEDRHYWVAGLIPVMNDSVTPELDAMVSASQGVVQLEIGEEIDPLSLLGAIVAQAVVPVAAWVTPPWVFRASGRAVLLPAAPASAADGAQTSLASRPPRAEQEARP